MNNDPPTATSLTASVAGVKAAQYVRMSTEHQKYSTANQAEAIQRYAESRGFTIVRTYEDTGKSGLRLDGRDALKQLIADVRNCVADFDAVLVYDVSRWGRFQDADESAYYEFICKEAGISVHYCAEQFENDGSLSATIIKNMKRAMAGEYSRELSAKVFAGQCRLIALGYRQGGSAGFGMRRLLIDEHGERKDELRHGGRKSLQTDRVVLIPGPEQEIRTVQRIYESFLKGSSESDIAAQLNVEGCVTDLGRPWTRGTVHQVLSNEKYIGNNVYNRTSFKLKAKRVANPPNMWVRANGAFAPVIQPSMFEAVQRALELRARRFTNGQMLDALNALLSANGALSGLLIDEQDAMPSTGAYRARFGSLLRAYELIGYTPRRDYQYLEVNKSLRRRYPDVIARIAASIESTGGIVRREATDLLVVNDELTVSVAISRCQTTAQGAQRWHVRLDAGLRPDVTLAVRMNGDNTAELDYYILPRIDIERSLRLSEDNGTFIDAYRADSLTVFADLVGRTPLSEVA